MTEHELIARNRATVERFLAGTHARDPAGVDIIDSTVAPGIVCHGFPNGMNPRDHESYKAFFREFQKAFAEIDFSVESLIADERFVAVRWHLAGTHVGGFAGAPPSGDRIAFDGLVLYRLEEGLIAETWLRLDEIGLLRQIGALPSLAA